GPDTHRAAGLMLQNSICIEQNYKACFGMLMLHKKFGKDRLEAACARALNGSRVNYTLIKTILHRGLDKQQLSVDLFTIPTHENIRGKDHYQSNTNRNHNYEHNRNLTTNATTATAGHVPCISLSD